VTITPSGTQKLTAPVAATKGTNPTASPSGATQPLTTNPDFPLTQTVIQINASGITPANQVVVSGQASPLDGGATLTVTKWDPTGSSDFTLSIPGLGISGTNVKTFSSTSLLKGATTVSLGTNNSFRLTASNINYAALGLWEQDAAGANGSNPIFLGTFITGYETPVSGVPTTGTASYSGTQNVTAIVSSTQGGQLSRASVLGDGNYTANFGTGTLNGTFTNMTVITANPNATVTPWNNVSVSASIAGNRFTNGSVTAAAPASPSNYTVTGGTTGKFDGGFYGPNADELAGVWSLTDSSHAVIGVATGRQH